MQEPASVVVLMDTTYFGRVFGVMLFKDAYTGKNLLKYYVKSETNQKYKEGIECLINKGFTINAQAAIIRRYLTKTPKTDAAKELKAHVKLLSKTDKESFVGGLNDWHSKWEKFLKERSINPKTNKSQYTHRKLRSAYNSLKNNLPWLFTWYDFIELKIPNTTNGIDGHFADLKNKLRNHNGLTVKHKQKFIDEFLKA